MRENPAGQLLWVNGYFPDTPALYWIVKGDMSPDYQRLPWFIGEVTVVGDTFPMPQTGDIFWVRFFVH
jgi:hypothetical protein